MPERKVRHILWAARLPLSLDMPTGIERDGELGDLVEDTRVPMPEEEATRSALIGRLCRIFRARCAFCNCAMGWMVVKHTHLKKWAANLE